MEEIKKIIHSQDAGFKLSPKKSGETSLNLSNDLLNFITDGSMSLDSERSITFQIYKEDYLKSLAYITCKLPLYKSSSKDASQIDFSIPLFEDMLAAVNEFFGQQERADYQVNIIYRKDGRIYLNGLKIGTFSIRSYLVEEHSTIIFSKQNGKLSLRVLMGQTTERDSYKSNLHTSFLSLPYLTAIHTKPFLLLAGISGTGKSRIVRKLAQATTTEELQKKYGKTYEGKDFDEERWSIHSPENFQLIQVKPNWHNSMDVVGYLSNIPSPHYVFTPFINFIVKAWRNPGIPFFLCLDEMNLAPVEEYFAEFLSAIESRSKKNGKYKTDPIIKPFNEFGKEVAEKMIDDLFPDIKAHEADERLAKLTRLFREQGLTLPENLIVIGTVNMDETTFSFSRKVLDRAMSIEMNDVNYDDFLAATTDDGLQAIVEAFSKGDGASLNELLTHRHIEAKEVIGELGGEEEGSDARFVVGYLKQVNSLLEGTPFKLGYRAANEALIYLDSTRAFGISDRNAALDDFTLMKILSRIEGDESKLKITSSESDKRRLQESGVSADEASRYGDLTILTAMREIVKRNLSESAKSIAKIDQMTSMLARDHFVSYWN